MRKLYFFLAAGIGSLAAIAACGTDSGDSTFVNPDGGDGTSNGSLPPILGGDGSADPDAFALAIAPLDPVVTYTSGSALPTVQFTAMEDGNPVPASFTIDRGEIGTEGLSTGLFTASGSVGGKATVTASLNGKTVSTSVTVKLAIVDVGGGAAVGDAGGGAGGNGGVGGEGPGAAPDAGTIAVLKGTPVADTGLAWLYPFDQTVWPRGILAPLLQWQPGAQTTYDAVRIQLSEASFTYDGYFAATAPTFNHHPILQAAWNTMLLSNASESVTVTLTFAKGGVAYGPITETWKISSAPLKGTVYYNSYGTNLVKNYAGALPSGSALFGAATLAIKTGKTPPVTDPVVIAGTSDVGTGGNGTGCRVCHSVASNGSSLITQRDTGDHMRFSSYDLKTDTETQITPEGATADFAWPAIFPDGSLFLGDSSSAAGSTSTPNQLFTMTTGASPQTPGLVTTTGWPTGFRAAYPAFSPDGKNLAFTVFDPAASGVIATAQKTLGIMTFDKTTNAFGVPTPIYTPADTSTQTAIFPSFLPTNDGIVFELETKYNTRDYGGTRSQADVAPPDARADEGTHAELWWLSLKTTPPTAHRLDTLDGHLAGGMSYLPTGPNAHADDTTLNYEPTVNPVPSGGYAWVVFTSRRLYGNVATINPFYSDPRFHDLTSTPTPKKLWVAAIDLNAPPGTDPSHPAFYLPAQELLAGNSRGYWVVDPCMADGSACETGDECCGGFCRAGADGGLMCTDEVPACAQEFEKCTVDGDCCNSAVYKCIDNRCALPAPH